MVSVFRHLGGGAKISDLCAPARARAPAPSLALVLARGVQRKGDRRRASVNIVLSACGSCLLTFLPSFLPSSVFFRSFSLGKENLEWIEGFGFWIHFHMLQPFKRGLPLDWTR